MRQTFLHSEWVFFNATERVPFARSAVQYQPILPATVPGHVHLDLVANGLIADPFNRMNELGSRWVDDCDWTYKTTFEWTPDPSLPNRALSFEGLDTVCKIVLNGKTIGEFDNMFVPVEIGVSDALLEGSNELEVRLSSPVRVGIERRTAYFESEGLSANLSNFDERAFVRKAQYMSGWDWGPRLVSCGIWRPVSLLEYAARVKSFTVFQSPTGNGGVRITTETVVEGSGDVTLTFGDHELTSSADAVQELDFVLDQPILWWPNGMGSQHLYPASASIEGGGQIHKKVGIRTVCLDRERDAVGETFTFVVNGKKVWARGANWIPNDSFPSQVTREDYRSQIESCKTLGMNMLRVWGGGLYELDEFYDACDEAGILVWQDFPYACSYYPDGAKACEVAKREADFQIRRLRDRASLALWCANNENLTMWQGKWGGKDLNPPRYYGENIYDGVLPNLIGLLDPQRSYIPTSPIGQDSPEDGDCNVGKFGDSHYWDVWHGRGDWIHYKDSDTRFSSEFGFASSCSMAQWRVALSEEDWRKDSPAVRWHDKTGKAWETFHGYITTHYPLPTTLEEWTYYSQLNQRDALRFGIEHWRRANDCQGTLIWQFNDCWPVQSWAVQDYLRLLKPAGFELGRLYADRLISLVKEDGELFVYAVNDGDSTWTAELDLRIYALADGSQLESRHFSQAVAPGARFRFDGVNMAAYPNAIARVQDDPVASAIALLSEPKDCHFAPVDLDVKVGESELTLSAKGIVVDLVVTDPDDPYNLKLVYSPLAGTPAVTLFSNSVRYTFAHKPLRLTLTSLHSQKTLILP